ncbi:MAG: GNAT family N-acetyltransferase [Chloroflexota bacterium]
MTYQQSLYRGHRQFDQLRQFLLDTYQQYDALRNWEPRRLEGTAFHNHPDELASVEAQMCDSWMLWYDTNHQIIGALFSEYAGGFYPQLHPMHFDVIPQMIDYLAPHPTPTIDVWCHADNHMLAEALSAAGFRPTADYQNQKRLDLMAVHLVMPSLPSGYRIDVMTTDYAATDYMGHLLNSAFSRNIHSGAEYRTFQQMAPSYRTEFDTVIYDAHGTLVANAGMTVHEAQSFAVIEPVATHPHHQRRGLARAAITHGLIRAQQFGIRTAWIEAWHSNVAANHTYNHVGFIDVSRQQCWQRNQRSVHS